MNNLQSINPFNLEVVFTKAQDTEPQILEKIYFSTQAFKSWSKTNFEQRSRLMNKLSDVLREDRQVLAELISMEMGCPVSQAISEVEKSAQLANYYADEAQIILATETLELGLKRSQIRFDSYGPVLHIAPWNYPLYLALRPIIPAVMAGNTMLSKHASNVTQMSETIQELFEKSGFDEGVVQSLFINSDLVEPVISHPDIRLVTLIGSENAGKKVASTAGSYLKKTLMELGGNDPFIVFEDADLLEASRQGSTSRLRNQGQSCNASKRFIVHKSLEKEFIELLKTNFSDQVFGDPMEIETTFGPLATESGLLDTQRQVAESVKMGAEIVIGGHGEYYKGFASYDEFLKTNPKGYFYPPTILTNITISLLRYQFSKKKYLDRQSV